MPTAMGTLAIWRYVLRMLILEPFVGTLARFRLSRFEEVGKPQVKAFFSVSLIRGQSRSLISEIIIGLPSLSVIGLLFRSIFLPSQLSVIGRLSKSILLPSQLSVIGLLG